MKARFVRENNQYRILCTDGTVIATIGKPELSKFLSGFKLIDELKGKEGNWNTEYPDMVSYPGTTVAYVTDTFNLVIEDFSPFAALFEDLKAAAPEDLISAADYAKQYGKSVEQVKVFCRQNRILGAVKMGRDWWIPVDAPYPEDRRITSGVYLRK